MSEQIRADRDKILAWEQGFKAGRRSAVTGLPTEKNPYGVLDPPDQPGPPPFPEFYIRLDEGLIAATDRWAAQMREFKTAWDEWARRLR